MIQFVIEREKVIHNTDIVKKYAGGRLIYAVLKGNAYGLGLVSMAEILNEQGINHFAVTEAEDAVALRQLFPKVEILLMAPVYEEDVLVRLIEHTVTLTVSSLENAEAVGGICRKHHLAAEAHLEVDTGMGRYGFLANDHQQIYDVYTGIPAVNVTGIYTHIYGCGRKRTCTRRQVARFKNILVYLRERGAAPGIAHVANSVTLFKFRDALFDAVRIGSAFTGRLNSKNKYNLRKVGHIEAQVGEIKEFPKGHNIGYGGVCKTHKATRAAIIPVGYAQYFCVSKIREARRFVDIVHYILSDLKRFMQNRHPTVSIRGKELPILGQVGMNHTVVDLMGQPCAVGDRVHIEINPILCGTMMQRKYV